VFNFFKHFHSYDKSLLPKNKYKMVPHLELIKKFYGFLQIKIKNIHFIVYGYEANGF